MTCNRCGRPLTDPVSVARGMGPECAARDKPPAPELPMPKAAEYETMLTNQERALADALLARLQPLPDDYDPYAPYDRMARRAEAQRETDQHHDTHGVS